MKFSQVSSSSIDKLKRSIIKVLRLGKSDVQTSFQVLPFGLDSVPIKDLVAIHSETSEKGKTVIVGYLNKNQLAKSGEYRTYSTNDDGVEQTYIYQKKDGIIEVGGDSDFMVRYSKLEQAFNELNNKFNTLVSSYNSHVHITTATVSASPVPGVISPTVAQAQTSVADITQAKIDTIKTK